MKKILLAGVALAALTGAARADVVLTTGGSNGTGDNVTFDSASGNLARASLNGKHDNIVHFIDEDGNFPAGSVSGNDIKIVGVDDIGVQVFNATETAVVGTTKQVFSFKGDGNISLTVNAVDKFGNLETFTFPNMGQPGPFPIGGNQSFFELNASNGEVMTFLEIKDVGGTITDFEHYRIDVAVAAVPELSSWAMFLIGFAGIGTLAYRRKNQLRVA